MISESEYRKRRARTIIILLFLAVGTAAGAYWASWSEARAEIAKRDEAAKAAENGWIAARDASKKQLLGAIKKSESLQNQLDELQESTSKLEPKIVTKWRTREIEVPVEKLVPGPERRVEVEVPGDCTLPETPPDPRFRIVGRSTHLESRAGNLFVIGESELWRVFPPPDELLGASAWEADATEIARHRPTARAWRANLLLGTSDAADVRFGMTWQRRSRLGWWGMASYDPGPEDLSVLVDSPNFFRTAETDQWGFAGGVSFTLGRR